MQKTAYKRRISDWSSDVCSSDLSHGNVPFTHVATLSDPPIALQTQRQVRPLRGPEIPPFGPFNGATVSFARNARSSPRPGVFSVLLHPYLPDPGEVGKCPDCLSCEQ